MKTLFALCLVTTLGFSTAQSAQQEGNQEAAKIAREGSQAVKDQDWNKAIDLFRKAAEKDRKYTQTLAIAYQQRAFSYASDQRFQDALNDLGEAIQINPRDARAYEQRAAIEMKINDYDRALADYETGFRRMAGDVPEFGFWVNLVDHQATRARMDLLTIGLAALRDSLNPPAPLLADDETVTS